VQPWLFPGAPSVGFRVVTPDEAPVLLRSLRRYETELGADFLAYRNHCLRVLSFALHFLEADRLTPDEIASQRPSLEAALAYHDIALWSDGALDYLDPSAARALSDLKTSDVDLDLVYDVIEQHHKATPFRSARGRLHDAGVNAVRRADWLDFTQNAGLAVVRSGMPSGNIALANAALPFEGFIFCLANMPFKLKPENPLKGNLEVMRIFKW